MSTFKARVLISCLVGSLLLLPCQSVEGPIVTEQNTTGLSWPRLFVQVLTEPEHLIRFFEGWDVAWQMFKSWGKSGMALATLPFNKDFMYHNKDFLYIAREVGPYQSGGLKAYYYAQVPTRDSSEAPRFIKMTDKGPVLKPEVHRPSLFAMLGLTRKKDSTLNSKLTDMAPGNLLTNDILTRRKRSTVDRIAAKPFPPLPILLKHHLLKKDNVEKIVDFLNEALEFLDFDSSSTDYRSHR